MMRGFLEAYSEAINLDEKKYNLYFPSEINRADFLLFNQQIICEIKEIQDIKISDKVERLSRKTRNSEENLKRDLYNSINKALSKANRQIKDTANALGCPDALGLVILENLIPKNLSGLSLVSAAERKMLKGLDNIDCVLCIDSTNIFSNLEGNQNSYTHALQEIQRMGENYLSC